MAVAENLKFETANTEEPSFEKEKERISLRYFFFFSSFRFKLRQAKDT
jgi:hypothetical protein